MGSESAGLVVELDESACWGLLRSAEVGRLAVVVNHRPEIFPINFVVDHATVVFRTAGGTKLEWGAGRDVAFEVDGYEPDRWGGVECGGQGAGPGGEGDV